MTLPKWLNIVDLKSNIEDQHKNLIKMFPWMIWKFYTNECVKDSELDNLIRTKKGPKIWWSYIHNYCILDDDKWKTYAEYMRLHMDKTSSRAIWFTPNWDWQQYHIAEKKTVLDVKASNGVKWMYCIPLDIDKKDYDKHWIPLPQQFIESWISKWIDTDPQEFVTRWFDTTKDLVPDWAETINKNFYKNIVENISWINITPWWFHAYIMIDPEEREEDPFYKDMTAEDFKMYMDWFHKLTTDLMFDSSRINLNDVMRLPASLHRKNKTKVDDMNNEFICMPCAIKSINYSEEELDNESWTVVVKREHVAELWNPFEVSPDNIKYAKRWRVRRIFTDIKKRLDDPKFMEKIDWYKNPKTVSSYKAIMNSKQLTISEKEIWNACVNYWLTRWDVINNLPGHYVQFDWNQWALKALNKTWWVEKTDWYKFKRLQLLEVDNIGYSDKIEWKDWVWRNYCWWYVNDWFSKNWRPAWPMLNFVFMYMKIYQCKEWAPIRDIYNKVKQYFKEICPEIDEELLCNMQPIANWEDRRIGTPANYLELHKNWVSLVYVKQAANGRDVPLEKWFTIFERPVDVVWKLVTVIEWPKLISNEWIEYWDIYERYILKQWDREIKIASKISANTFEDQLQRLNSWLHFLWNDNQCKRFFNALDSACEKSLESHAEYWIKLIHGNQWSKYWINQDTWWVYCVIWNTPVRWDAPKYLDYIDESSRDIIDKWLEQVSLKEYWKKIEKLWNEIVYKKIFISCWSCQFMNIAEEVMNANLSITLWPNVNIYWGSETWKSSLRYAIQASLWYKVNKRCLSMQMTTPQPLIDSMCDWSTMIFEEVTSKVESDQKRQEVKEIVLRWAANKEVKTTWWVTNKRSVKMRSNNILIWETAIKDDSANNRMIKIKLTKNIRNWNKEEWETALRRLQQHTISDVLYWAIWEWYEPSKKKEMFSKLKVYKSYISSNVAWNERIWDLECYWMFLYTDILKLWTKEEFMEMIIHNHDKDISNNRDITKTDPEIAFWDLVASLIGRAARERVQVSYWSLDIFPDQYYNWESMDDRVLFIKISASEASTNITNFDNDVEKLKEIMPWFANTINWSVCICCYNQTMLRKLKSAIDDEVVEWINYEKFTYINEILTNNMMDTIYWMNRTNWISYNKAYGQTSRTMCTPDVWKLIKKTVLSCWLQL